MHADGWTPDFVVGIDFGMTCTGVAYSLGPNWPEPKTFQHWPGKMINELANKVPTMVQYSPDSSSPKAWGFLCDQESPDPNVKDRFKLHLDPTFRSDPRHDAPTLLQARTWFQDYLQGIHDHIAEVFSDSFPKWRAQKVDFVFSVPTTWNHPGMINETTMLVRKAGFGKDGQDHRARIGLTEAEAAAVYALKQQYEKDDVVLVCDAGGGTTDVNVLQLKSSTVEPTRLHQLSWVEGRPIGSTSIDMEFHGMIVSRLSHIRDHLRDDPETVADQMMHGRFERYKCSYGTAHSNSVPNLLLKVPDLEPGQSFPDAMIDKSSMNFSRGDMKGLFDVQIAKILALTDDQIEKVAQNRPGTQMSYLVLSGGLGSSAYVRQRLKSHYATGPGLSRPGVEKMAVLTVPEPQLAVSQGLVMDRIQAIDRGNEIFSEYCCRLSFGVITKEEYNPSQPRHINQPVSKDPMDGKNWVEDQIEWFVKQGESVSTDGVLKPYMIKHEPGKETQPWQARVVMSNLPREQLPTSIHQDGSQRLCNVSAVLKDKEVDMKLKNRHWYNRGKKHWRFKFDIKVVVGAADLRFVLMTKDKRIISDDHDAIEVVWEPTSQPSSDAVNDAVPLYAVSR